MQQLHKNLFFSYRGSRRESRDSLIDFERQLEDNATRALIYVLEHSDRKMVLVPFLRKIVGLRHTEKPDLVQFALQRVRLDRPNIHRRIALAIAPEEKIRNIRHRSKESGRPDGWIWSDDRFAILIESKVRGQANWDQIHRHIETNKWPLPPRTQIKPTTWAKIYTWLGSVRHDVNRLDDVSKMLVSEYQEYLKMAGLAKTIQFEVSDFAYFSLPEKERDQIQKRTVADKLERLTSELAKKSVLRRIARLYSCRPSRIVNPGMFRKSANSFWITIGPKKRRTNCHLTVRVCETGIQLDAFAPHRRYTRDLVRKIKHDSAGFLKSVHSLPEGEPFIIRLREAYYYDPKSKYKGRRIKRTLERMEIHPSVLNECNLSNMVVEPTLKRLKNHKFRTEIFLVRTFPLGELNDSGDVVNLLAKAAEKMIPFLKYAINLD